MDIDTRVETGDLMEGYSGDCIGKGDMQTYIVGGQTHNNDMNHCMFTPLKGVIKFNINEGDIEAMIQLCKKVLFKLHPEWECMKCGTKLYFTHFIVSENRRYCCQCWYTKKGK